MNREVREIIETPCIIVENELDDIPPLEFPRFRRTRTLKCSYCKKLWGDIIYNNSSIRICFSCSRDIIAKSFEFKKNIQMVSETFEIKKRVLEDIIEVGYHPDRTWQTQLVDTLYLFKQPNFN